MSEIAITEDTMLVRPALSFVNINDNYIAMMATNLRVIKANNLLTSLN